MPETLKGRWGEREETKRKEGRMEGGYGKGEEGERREGKREGWEKKGERRRERDLDKIKAKPETW